MWTVVVPVKGSPDAKSRLVPASDDPAAHRRLVAAIRHDTVTAAAAAEGVARVLLVLGPSTAGTGRATGGASYGDAAVPVERIVQTTTGLNPAVAEGAAHARVHWPDDGVAVLVGDLPALRPVELADALRHAAGVGSGYVPDHDGTGTTVLAATPGRQLRPSFGAGSARRHATAARAVPAGPGLRRDVDTPADLAAALDLGVGPATSQLIAELHADHDRDPVRSPADGIMTAMTDTCGATPS